MKMQSIKRGGFLLKNRLSSGSKSIEGFASFVDHIVPSKCLSKMGFVPYSSAASEKTAIDGLTKWAVMRSSYAGEFARDMSHTPKVMHEAGGLLDHFKKVSTLQHLVILQSPLQHGQICRMASSSTASARSFASKASDATGQNKSEARKDVATVEDPFDSPTYNIPEKPVTFTEGASYSVIILAGLGIAAAAAYAVFKELIFQPKEYKIFGKALERIQNDGQVRVRIGGPITGYGSESKNRAARQRIPNRTWTDEDGIEHVEVNFYVRGPHGAGKVYTEMFKDKEDKQWKFTYLIVEINSPSPARLMLESYVPA